MSSDMKSKLPRYLVVPALLLALLAVTPLVRAEETSPAKEKPLSKAKGKYDADKDGKLSDAEKAELKEDEKEKRQAKKLAELEKYDANRNGKIDPEEKEKMKADQEAEKSARLAEAEKLKAERAAKKAEKAAAKETQK